MQLAAHEEGSEMGEADPTVRGPLSASAPVPAAERRSDVELTGHAQPPGVPRSRSGRPPRVLIGLAGLVAAAAIAVVALKVVSGAGGSTPESTVREFFAAWSRGDAGTVARDSVLQRSGQAQTGIAWDQKALASMLSLPQNRRLMMDVKITDTATQADVTSVTVTMRYNGVPYFMRLDVRRVQGHWQIAMYPSILSVELPDLDTTVTVDGVPVHGNANGGVELDVFPGAHRVHMNGSAIVNALDVVSTPVEPYKTADVTLTPTFTPAATAAAHQAIHAWLTKCAGATQLQPGNGCPQNVYRSDSITNVHWTLTQDGSDATMQVATLTSATATGNWAMTVAFDDTYHGPFETLQEHQQDKDGGGFTVTLTWNGSGFDLQPQQ